MLRRALTKRSRNALFIACSEFCRKGVLYLAVVLAARALGVRGFGEFSALMATGAVIAVISDLGLGDMTVRELARDPGRTEAHVGTVVGLKLVLAGVVLLASLIVGALGLAQPVPLALATAYYVLASFSQFGASIFRAREQMQYEALVRIVEFSVLIVLVYLASLAAPSITLITLMFVMSGLVGVCAALGVNVRKFTPVRPRVDVASWKRTLGFTAPFALSLGLFLVYYRANVLILRFLTGEVAAGLFNAGYQLVLGAFVVPFAISAAAYPGLSRAATDRRAFMRHATFPFLLVLVLGLIASATLYVGAPLWLRVLYGSPYLAGVSGLRILALGVPFMFATTFLGVALQARNQAGFVSVAAGLNLATALGVSLVLVPRLGLEGTSIVVVVTEALSLVWMGAFLAWGLRPGAIGHSQAPVDLAEVHFPDTGDA